MPASRAALTCGTSTRGSVPASRSIRLAFWLMPAFMPCTHWLDWPWFSQTVNLKPTLAAAAAMAFSMFAVNGLAEETGMLKIDLPCMHFLASNAGPGAMKLGLARNGSSRCSKYSRLSASAGRMNSVLNNARQAMRNHDVGSMCVSPILLVQHDRIAWTPDAEQATQY